MKINKRIELKNIAINYSADIDYEIDYPWSMVKICGPWPVY